MEEKSALCTIDEQSNGFFLRDTNTQIKNIVEQLRWVMMFETKSNEASSRKQNDKKKGLDRQKEHFTL